MNLINKRASEKILSIWWFTSLAFVGAVVVFVIVSQFGSFVDVRDKEARSLQEKIMDCIFKNGYINEEVLFYSSEDFMNLCKLNTNQFKSDSEFLFNVTIYNSQENAIKEFSGGAVGKYQEDCLALVGIDGDHLPYCIQTKERVNYFDPHTSQKEVLIVYLLVASNNQGSKKFITVGDEK